MIITDSMHRYIALQRTGYGKNADIAKCYEGDISRTYESIKAYLPENCSRILDIGCGLGGIDLMVYNHYNGNVELNLLDYSKVDDKIHYGYQNTGSIYNSLELSREFLVMNGVDESKIRIHNAENEFPIGRFDVVLSILSCGFHYPVSTYLDKVKICLGGVAIFDIRKDTDQIEELKANFNEVKVIAEYKKCYRTMFK